MGVVCQRGDDGADECAYRNGTYFCNEWIDADPEVRKRGEPSLGVHHLWGCAVWLERPVAVRSVGRVGWTERRGGGEIASPPVFRPFFRPLTNLSDLVLFVLLMAGAGPSVFFPNFPANYGHEAFRHSKF